ncbi:MAG: hypothetical protein PVG78_05460 [Desulfobacterales bacterium]|jgi:hypothetical protein
MTISLSYEKARDLTRFVAEGELTYEDQMAALRTFYEQGPSANVLWDFRRISGSRITSEGVEGIVAFLKSHKGKRINGKTALVAPTDLDFGLSRIGEAYAACSDLAWEIRAFRSMAEAIAWIDAPAGNEKPGSSGRASRFPDGSSGPGASS